MDGGIGFAVEEPHWEIEVGRGEDLQGAPLTPEIASAVDIATKRLCRLWNVPPFSVRARSRVDAHAGLGSKTAILLAAGHAAAMLAGRRASADSLARTLGRGGTSGIGVNCFTHGGFVWDAGHVFREKGLFAPSSGCLAPPAKAIVRLPVRWLSVVHFRFAPSGLHGGRERRVFSERCPTPDSGTIRAHLAVSALILPGLLERREELLHRGLKTLQNSGFKKIEWEHQDQISKAFRAYWAASKRAETLCLSSFGPTMYVLTTDPQAVVATINRFGERPVHLTVTNISNVGCEARRVLRKGDEHISSVSESRSIVNSPNSGVAPRMPSRSGISSAIS